jgi:hypothetical protein
VHSPFPISLKYRHLRQKKRTRRQPPHWPLFGVHSPARARFPNRATPVAGTHSLFPISMNSWQLRHKKSSACHVPHRPPLACTHSCPGQTFRPGVLVHFWLVVTALMRSWSRPNESGHYNLYHLPDQARFLGLMTVKLRTSGRMLPTSAQGRFHRLVTVAVVSKGFLKCLLKISIPGPVTP